jgi:acyl carrier protein
MSPLHARIRAFIQDTFQAPEDFPADRSLLDSGIIDSIGVLTLVTWIEQEFGFLIDDEDVLPENLDGIDALAAFVARKRAAAADAAALPAGG